MSDALTFISFLKEISRHTVTGLLLHHVIVKNRVLSTMLVLCFLLSLTVKERKI